jgi:hypothetical protein
MKSFISIALVSVAALVGCSVSDSDGKAGGTASASAPAPRVQHPDPRLGATRLPPRAAGAAVPTPRQGRLGPPRPRVQTGPSAAACGDGVLEAGEDCDEGTYATSDTACTQACQLRDLIVPRAAAPDGSAYNRTLGTGRHPIATRTSDFGIVYIEQAAVPRVVFRTFDWRGIPLLQPIIVDANALDDASPSVAVLPDGRFLVVWANLGVDERDIAMRTVDPTTGALGPLAYANQMTNGTQDGADVVCDGTTLAVAWTDYSDPANGPDIRYQLFSAGSLAPTLPVAPGSPDPALAATPAVEGSVTIELASASAAGSSFAFAWRDEQADGERLQVAWGSTRQTLGPFPAGATGDRPAVRGLDGTHLLVAYSEGTDPTSSGVANVPQLRAAIVDANAPAATPFWVTSPYAVGQDQPALTGSGQTTFLAWRNGAASGDVNGDELELLPLTWDGASLNGGAAPLGSPMPLPRWSKHQVGDQRLPALTLATFGGAPELVSAWVDLGRDFTSAEANGDIAFQIAPLPLSRNGTTPPPEPAPTLWSLLIGDAADWVQVYKAVVTPDGNVVVSFDLYADSFDFGCGPFDIYTSSVIVKYSALDGHCIWSTGINVAHIVDWTYAYALIADESGDLYVGGIFQGTANIGGGLTNTGADNDVFLTKLAGSDGTIQWANRYGGPYDDQLGWNGIDVRNGVIALAARYVATGNFGGADFTALYSGLAVATYSAATGAAQWSTAYTGTYPGFDYATEIAFARDGALLLSAGFDGDLVFGPTHLASTNTNNYDVALARLDGSNGAPLAVRQFNPGPSQWPNFTGLMREDPQGGILLLSWVSTGADLGAGPITVQSTNQVPLMMHLDDNLATTQWMRIFEATDAMIEDVRFDVAGDRMYVIGHFQGNMSFGPTQITSTHPSSDDGFLAALSSTADLLWAETRTDTEGSRDPYSVAVGPSGRLYLVDQVNRSTSWAAVSVTQGP